MKNSKTIPPMPTFISPGNLYFSKKPVLFPGSDGMQERTFVEISEEQFRKDVAGTTKKMMGKLTVNEQVSVHSCQSSYRNSHGCKRKRQMGMGQKNPDQATDGRRKGGRYV